MLEVREADIDRITELFYRILKGELAAAGEVGSVADFHYSVMGAGWLPHEIEATARELAGMLKEDKVNAVLLSPV